MMPGEMLVGPLPLPSSASPNVFTQQTGLVKAGMFPVRSSVPVFGSNSLFAGMHDKIQNDA